MVENNNIVEYNGRDWKSIFGAMLGFIANIAIILFNLFWIINWFLGKDSFPLYMIIILFLILIFNLYFFTFLSGMVHRSKLIISNSGIEFYRNNILKYDLKWKDIDEIGTEGIGYQFTRHDIIFIKIKNLKTLYEIEYLPKKELILAFRKMKIFAEQYNISVKDNMEFL